MSWRCLQDHAGMLEDAAQRQDGNTRDQPQSVRAVRGSTVHQLLGDLALKLIFTRIASRLLGLPCYQWRGYLALSQYDNF